MLLNLSDKKVLYAKGAYNKVYPASITKIMTAMLALKYGNMDDTVTISQENVTLESGSQVAGFQAGDQVTMDQLLHCLLVYSANDAASAIAEHIGGSTDKFVEMMNSFAAELGCTGTHFTNPHGLQDENHYTTPYDIYLMLKEALNYPEFTDITQMASYTVAISIPMAPMQVLPYPLQIIILPERQQLLRMSLSLEEKQEQPIKPVTVWHF